jgi:hypothetical protein
VRRIAARPRVSHAHCCSARWPDRPGGELVGEIGGHGHVWGYARRRVSIPPRSLSLIFQGRSRVTELARQPEAGEKWRRFRRMRDLTSGWKGACARYKSLGRG